MKKLLICGMLLGLLTSLSYAQRGRAVGGHGVGTVGARMPNADPVSPHAGMNPSAIGIAHGGVLPNARTAGETPRTIAPNATINPKARTVGPNSVTTPPNKVNLPNAHTGPSANQ